MKLGSLFDGIGGFLLSATLHGIEPVWASEIEKFPIEVTKARFPNMKHLGDITQINGAEIEPVDIITGGFPCQDVSVAGKREGLAGARSGLFFEAVRVIKEMQDATVGEYPKFVVIENVPGLLSSNKGQDILAVLDEMQELGFVVDMNILDAQYMGVPQRRKRVFIVCVSLSSLPKMRTILSEQISTGLVVTLLQKSWADIQEALAAERSPLDYGRKTEQFATSLQKKMNLLKRELGEQPLLKLLGNLAEHRQPSEIGESNFLGVTSDSSKQSHLSTQAGTEKYRLKTLISEVAIGTESMFMLSNKILVEASQQKKSSTISTLISETMRETIFTCSQTVLNMARLMVVCEDWQKIYYEQVSSILTVMKECIGYAKQASGNLLEPMEWVERWHDYISAASDCREQIERHLAGRSGQEVFPISESVPGDIAESRKAREEVACGAGDGTTTASGDITPTVSAKWAKGTVSAKWAKGTGGPAGDECQNLVAVAPFNTGQITSPQNGNKVEFGLPCHTLSANEHPPSAIISYSLQGSMIGRADKNGPQGDGVNEDVSFTLNTTDRHAVAYGIRTAQTSANGHGIVEDKAHTLDGAQGQAVAQLYENHGQDSRYTGPLDVAQPVTATYGMGGNNQPFVVKPLAYTVRRLTVVECLRLMGFPSSWFDGVPGYSDTQGYKAVGNSIAVPCVDWIMGRIKAVIT